jgi:hypothetical protein
MYFQTGQVIFVPEWPKGEFVSILASFCVWTKSLICKDATNRDSTVQSEVRRISKFPVSRPDDVSSRPDARQSSFICPNNVLLPSEQLTVSRSFCASLLRPDVSAARPDAYQFSNGSLMLSKFQEGEINQPSGRCGIPFKRVSP